MGAKPASAWAAAIDEEILRFLFDFGATAAIGEMLLDSRPGDLRLLPALPAALPDGEAEGLTAQGGAAVSLAWGLGHLIRATLRATRAQELTIRYAGNSIRIHLRAGQVKMLYHCDLPSS